MSKNNRVGIIAHQDFGDVSNRKRDKGKKRRTIPEHVEKKLKTQTPYMQIYVCPKRFGQPSNLPVTFDEVVDDVIENLRDCFAKESVLSVCRKLKGGAWVFDIYDPFNENFLVEALYTDRLYIVDRFNQLISIERTGGYTILDDSHFTRPNKPRQTGPYESARLQ